MQIVQLFCDRKEISSSHAALHEHDQIESQISHNESKSRTREEYIFF